MAEKGEINVGIWHDGVVWRYEMQHGNDGNEVLSNRVEGFSDDFDELFAEALAKARKIAEVLRGG